MKILIIDQKNRIIYDHTKWGIPVLNTRVQFVGGRKYKVISINGSDDSQDIHCHVIEVTKKNNNNDSVSN